MERRVTMLPQSAMTGSTLAPIFFRFSTVISVSAFRLGMSAAPITTIFSPLYPDSFRSWRAFSRFCLA